MNKQDFKKIIETINKIWLNNYIRVANKESVYNLAKEINEVPGVINTELSEPRQVNYRDFDGVESFLFEYNFLIEINNIKLKSKIRLIPLGDAGYNIVLCLNNDNMLKESYDPNKFSIKNFIIFSRHFKNFIPILEMVKCCMF